MASSWPYQSLYDAIVALVIGKTLKILLVTPSDTYDQVNDTYVSDISANELAGGNYARQTLLGVLVTKGTGGHAAVIDANDVIWMGLSGHAVEAAYVYEEDPAGDASSPLRWRIDGDNITTNGGNVTVKFHQTDGVANLNG